MLLTTPERHPNVMHLKDRIIHSATTLRMAAVDIEQTLRRDMDDNAAFDGIAKVFDKAMNDLRVDIALYRTVKDVKGIA